MNLNNNIDFKMTSVHVGQGYFIIPSRQAFSDTATKFNINSMIWNSPSRAVLGIKPFYYFNHVVSKRIVFLCFLSTI